jgi:hypothetical protein
MENRKKMARAVILATTIVGGILMFAQPFEAQAYSGGGNCFKGKPVQDSNGIIKCSKSGSECLRTC